MHRFLVLVMVAIGCHRASPTEPQLPLPMGALGDATIEGRVSFIDGQPVAGAWVRFLRDGSDATYGARTDSQGRFYEADLWHGDYTFSVKLSKQQQPYASGHTTLKRGSNFLPIVLPAAPCVFLTGRVTEAGNPYRYVRGANVTLLFKRTTTIGDGTYALDIGCPPTSAGDITTMTVQHPSYNTVGVSLAIPPASTTINVQMVPR